MMHRLSDSLKNMGTHTPKHITTKDPEFEELRAVYQSYSHECREVKLLARRLQDDIRIMSKAYVDFGMELERYFLATGDPMGPLFRSYTFLIRDQMRAIEFGLGDTVSAMELATNVNEGFRRRISHRDDVRSDMDRWFKYREKGHREEQKYTDYMKQYEEVNTLLKSELRTLRENQWKFKDNHLRKLVTLQSEAFRLLAQGSQELEVGLNLRGQTWGSQGQGIGQGIVQQPYIGQNQPSYLVQPGQQGQFIGQSQQLPVGGGVGGGGISSGVQQSLPISSGWDESKRDYSGNNFDRDRALDRERELDRERDIDRERSYERDRNFDRDRNLDRERQSWVPGSIPQQNWQQQQQFQQYPGGGGISSGVGQQQFGGLGQQQLGGAGGTSGLQSGTLPILGKYLQSGGLQNVHIGSGGNMYPTRGGGFVPATTLSDVGGGVQPSSSAISSGVQPSSTSGTTTTAQ
jgi:hypothetical protein